jgi:glycosyltransferase involved in cell wall biosynthesis
VTRFLFLAAEGFPPTVYDAQVGDLLRALARLGLPFDALNLDPLLPRTLLTRTGRERIRRLAAAVPGRLRVRPYVPFEDRVGAPLATLLVARELRRGPVVVHARGPWAALAAVRASQARGVRARVVYDVRGDYEAEHAFHVAGRGDAKDDPRVAPGLARLRRAEATIVAGADRLLCVSRRLAEALDARHPGALAKADVIPCGHDPAKFRLDPAAREAWRTRLGLADRWVVVYAGALGPYHLPDAVVRAGLLARRVRPDAHLLLLTPDVARGRALVEGVGLGPADATVRSAPHDEVPGLLAAADVALLLRRPDPVNAVASPTKLAEYLACGLPVVVSDGIGDASDLVRETGAGRVVADLSDEALAGAFAGLMAARPSREEVAAVAAERLARDRFFPVYARLYRELAARLE